MLALFGALSLASVAHAAPRKHAPPRPRAEVQGIADRALRQDVQRAVGEADGAPVNRIEARRRARQGADSATALLRSEGYYDATVTPDIGDGERPTALVKITLGPRTLLTQPKVVWDGAEPAPAAETAAVTALKLKPGDPGRAAEVIAAEGRVVAALQQAGYADAKADPREVVVDHTDHSMSPTYRIASGSLVRMDGMVVDGKTHTRVAWLRKLAPWKTHEVYKPADVAELERRLLDTGVYDSVTVALAPKPNADGLRPVVVSLSDRSKSALSLGLGYSTTEGPLIDSTYSIYNVLNRADTVTFLARLQTIDTRFGVTESLPDFFSPGQTFKFGPDAFRDVTPAYTTQGAEMVFDLTQRYGKYSFVTKGLSFVYDQIDDHELGRLDIYSIRPLLSVSLDKTDNYLDANARLQSRCAGRADRRVR